MFRSPRGRRAIEAPRPDTLHMSHFYANLYVHLVWGTAGRAPLISERHAPRLHRRLAALVATARCEALAVGGVADHVHLLVALHPAVAVSALVRAVKASTSQWVRHELGTPDFAWQEGYGVFSLRDDDVTVVRSYVIRQPEHHAVGTTVASWERTSSDAATPRNPPQGG